MISWAGRVGGSDGSLKAGWYFQNNRYGNYHPNGLPSPPQYPKLAGNSLTGAVVIADGSVLLCGASGPRMWTSANAPVQWPAAQDNGGQACLVMLSPALDAMPFATVVGDGQPESGSVMQSMALNEDGLWMAGRLSRSDNGTVRHTLGLTWLSPVDVAALAAPAR